MLSISDLTPTNLHSELELFAQDHKYNPQFTYTQTIPVEYLSRWGQPKPDFVEIAKKIIITHLTQSHLTLQPPKIVDHHLLKDAIYSYLDKKHVRKKPEVLFSKHQIANCIVSSSTITFKDDLCLSSEDLAGLLRHEIETHFLRRYNHQQNQLKLKSNTDFGLTEEGLACINNYIFKTQKRAYKSALRYYGTYVSLHMSFTQMYEHLQSLNIAHKDILRTVVRAKRGVSDTSLPGGNTKDLIYLEGIAAVSEWLLNEKHEPRNLYIGRITLDEASSLSLDETGYTLTLPDFFDDMDGYKKAVQEIAQANYVL